MLELRDYTCFPPLIVVVYATLACVDAAIAVIAFFQLVRIHSRSAQLGWTRQKVFHLMIGLCNLGYVVFFVLTLIATCKGWSCWSSSCGFVFMAFPKILLFAAFLLLLSYWVDLCHQADDEEDDGDSSSCEALLDKTNSKPPLSNIDGNKNCLPVPSLHVGSRQRFVILTMVVVLVLMTAFAVLIWIGMGRNPIDSSTVARVYVDIFAVGIFLLGGALACYGLLIYLKMSKVRSEGASSEMWKVTGLAVVSLVCFTTSALIALLTDVPVLYCWRQEHISVYCTGILLMLYYFIGSSTPAAFVLWVMRELPPSRVADRDEESTIVTFISDGSTGVDNPQRWTAVTSLQNQGSKASPI
ncbi:tobamovirus multiplication protein 1-like isoform X1 [Chenopodium quinoa]|uniref:tobamovirus multiplication protein 1-like isoform X1 n=1 Tax=Chenopodium quinoa TaxID=63459 RepID=UPI000B77CBB4|nr:tobamovirus multiplication protein 1-like isoform X1 [Chenopodium quinoa]XP_021723003.1 tobamovirus multiplication protein 1-like isoform X1 [Chenopodium quinoa]